LDALHAAILNVKLDYLDRWMRRREIALMYHHALLLVRIPKIKRRKVAYHTYIIQTDNAINYRHISRTGIETKVHYPIPIHFQNAAKHLGYQPGDFPVTEKQVTEILSLPVYPELSDDQVNYVGTCIQDFFA
jgi:dTDP-4-amino-4,6-dideoxygalactose transaminase